VVSETNISVNVDGVIYRQKNDRMFVNNREVSGIEAEMAKAKMLANRRRIAAWSDSIRKGLNRLWR